MLHKPAVLTPLADTVDDFTDDERLAKICSCFDILVKAVVDHLPEALVSNMVGAFPPTSAKHIAVSENIERENQENSQIRRSATNQLLVIHLTDIHTCVSRILWLYVSYKYSMVVPRSIFQKCMRRNKNEDRLRLETAQIV
jgi:hypothetical protein